MTGRERFLAALSFQETDRPPHFEAMFELDQEAVGRRYPDAKRWGSCTNTERHSLIAECMEIHARVVARFNWDALVVFFPWGDPEGISAAKRTFGNDIAIGGMVNASIWSLDIIQEWTQFAVDLMENRHVLHEQAEIMCTSAVDLMTRQVEAGADFVFIPSDVAFNGGPFISPRDFAEVVAPYLTRVIEHAKSLGAITIFHSDGMLMPIMDQILAAGPHALHSIDPMAGMDIAEVKRITYGKMALMGNVACNLLQQGPEAAIRESARYCLRHAAPGGGYIFSSSNTIFPGMPLRNYEIMLDELRVYAGQVSWMEAKPDITNEHGVNR